MNVSTRLGLGVLSTLAAFGCGWHTPPPTGAVGHRVELPAGIVAALPADPHPALLRTATQCEAGDVSSCNRMAYTFAYGLVGDTNRWGFAEDLADRAVGPVDGSHGDAHGGDAHGGDAHGGDAHGGDAHGGADHGGEHAADHGGGHGPAAPVYGAVEPNPTLGVQLYQWSCDVGFPTGCVGLADLYERGHGVERDTEHAAQLVRQACEMGMPSACYQLAHAGAPDSAALLASACNAWFAPACDAVHGGQGGHGDLGAH